jgi:glycosyltransferase involved in cell wall biosynthesis
VNAATVSVLIPTYNGARHIRPALDSVLTQSGVGLEVIVVDDDSIDGTADLVESYTDPRIRVIRNPARLGAEGNWNRALELATGKYIKLLPQDDLLQPRSLAAQVATLDADADEAIALVFGSREIIGPTGKVLARRGFRGAVPGRIAATTLVRQCVRRGTNVIGEPGAVLFRRTLAKKVGRFDGQQGFVIDLDYWIRLLAHGDAWYIAEPVSSFRVSGGSWSVAIGRKQGRQYTDFIARMHAVGLISGSRVDLAIGKAAALTHNAMRLVFYRLFVR